jgi:hypothetical protein
LSISSAGQSKSKREDVDRVLLGGLGLLDEVANHSAHSQYLTITSTRRRREGYDEWDKRQLNDVGARAAALELGMNLEKVRYYIICNVLALVVSISAFACGPSVDVLHVNEQAAERLEKEVKIYDSTDKSSSWYATLGLVHASSCKLNFWDPPATQEDALVQLRYKAKALGADGLTDINCTHGGPSLSLGCWDSFTCQARAIRVTS